MQLRPYLMIASYVMLFLLVVAPVLFMMGRIELSGSTLCLNIATLGWFLTAPFWMNRGEKNDEEQKE